VSRLIDLSIEEAARLRKWDLIREIYGEQLDPYYKETETRVLKIKQIKGA